MADNQNSKKIKTSELLPRFYRSESNKKFIQATVDQLVQPGTVKKVNGYIGRQNAKATTGNDIFVDAVSPFRQQYQLEPGVVVKDELDNVTFFKDYQDYINQLNVFGGNVANHSRVNEQEFYSWDPHICWDKFVNFQNYYWLPYGPDLVKIAGQQQKIVSTYTVKIESELDSNEYVFTPNGVSRNPTLKLFKGQTYKFEINSPGNPFSIKTTRSPGTLDRYQTLDLSAGVTSGTITFTVPESCPDVLYYVSENDIDLGGVIHVKSIDENTAIDVDQEFIGKKTYKLATGEELSNGMKVSFIGKVTPESYASGQYYVEGVGSAIRLVPESALELISAYTSSEAILFDSIAFDTMPFSDATAYAGTPDYIVINRASADRNPWSRYNRWFHKDVIEASAKFNGKVPSTDQTARAVRPIIEFDAGLRLYNFGLRAIKDVDLVDTYTTDVFSTIEGTAGYNVDGIQLAQGMRVLFSADTDSFVKDKIYRVEFIDVLHLSEGSRQIHLVLEDEPALDQVVLVKQGITNQGSTFWYDGTDWKLAQQKLTLNQQPLFDIVDENGTSFSNISTYDGTSFSGTKLFSYKVGSGTADSYLGFALSYKNINNIGDIVFNFNIATDEFQYKDVTNVIKKNISTGYLVRLSPTDTIQYVNGWQKSTVTTTQAALRIYKNSNKTNNFAVDIFDDKNDLNDLEVRVYINGIRLDKTMWTLVDAPAYKKVVLDTDIKTTDVLTIRAFASQPINANGHYEVPINLQNNPLNNDLGDFTLGEVIDHVGSIVDNLQTFSGAYPGAGNLRDLGNTTVYGTKFVQHSGPHSLALYHVTSDTNNVIRSIESARDDYNAFKRNFITVAENIGIDTDAVTLVNLILQEINKDKPTHAPYYFSDMVGYNASIRNEYTVLDGRIKTYPLTSAFNLNALSNKAVGVYVNGIQLLYGKEYTFNDQGFIVISSYLKEDDTITVYEYESTDGCFVPETPTKLGIWPKFEPKIYVDTSLITPRTVIQGHDGSQILAYGDYRDDLIIELEKRIYNNIKVAYDKDIFNVHDVLPSYTRKTPYSLTEFNEVLAPQFYKWTSLINRDFSKPLSYDRDNPMTFNYRGHTAPDGRETPGYWRGIYRWMLDTDRPNLCPWEMLGFSEEPSWWTDVYGPAPYTSNNLVMWQDISEGLVREPNVPPVRLEKYAKPFLMGCIPVDESGNLLSPLVANLSTGVITQSSTGDFVFGDESPVEGAWRRSSHYPFAVLITAMLLQPARTFGTLLDRSRVVRNSAGQLVYKNTGLRIRPADVVVPSIYSSASRIQTAGILNYIVNYILSDSLASYNEYLYDLKNTNAHLSYRLAAFTSKEKFNLLLDSKTPLSQGSVFVPQEDYDIVLNSSSPIKKITYSGVIITKLPDGFEVKGYSKTQPYFKYYPWSQSGVTINVGGISESYMVWTPGEQYAEGKVVLSNNRFYRVLTTHTATSTFELQFFQVLNSLPMVGGQSAIIRKEWDKTSPITVPYGTKFVTVQETVDFIIGYGEWLKDQGFMFDDFNVSMNQVTNWETSAKEFLFWTTQNWSTGSEKWDEWSAISTFEVGTIVKYNGDYYRAIRKIFPDPIFDEEDYVKLDGLSSVGSSVISLSPAAAKLTFLAPLSVTDDITNPFNGYEIFKVDGTPIPPNALDSYRDSNVISYAPRDTSGIFGATFYLIQKEQVVIFKNATLFNDTIYNPESGYRQERIKVSGYVSTGWHGAFDAPGFVFDQARVNEWEAWKDYALGDIVKYKEFYYSASSFLVGTQSFEASSWIKLEDTPKERLLPNWTYKASQFEDFYSLDSDNFDLGQQQMAQHLIGYQKRQYLSNIIKDDVSEYKFYQGMIIEKGTQNVFNKLFDVLSADGKESLEFYEEWAIRSGLYGANASFENIEFVLDEAEFKSNPQGFELVSTVNPNVVDFISRQTPNDIYLKPLGYNNNPWPVAKSVNQFLRSAGYVRQDEVKAIVTTIDKITDEDITTFRNGDYVWVGFEGQSWNVYRYSSSGLKVVNATYSSTNHKLVIECRDLVSIPVGSFIGITQVTGFSGFYQVTDVSLNTFTVSATLSAWEDPFTQQDSIVIFLLKTQRSSSIDTAGEIIPQDLLANSLLWTDDGGTGKPTTWKYNPVFTFDDIPAVELDTNQQHGRDITINTAGSLMAVSDALGHVTVYDRPVPSLPWTPREVLLKPFISKPDLLGVDLNDSDAYNEVVAMSPNGTWLAIGSPRISYACTGEAGEGYTPTTDTGTNSELVQQGAVSLYKKDSNNSYQLISTFVSPAPADNELFGATISLSEDTMFVAATGHNSDAGIVYQYNYGPEVKATASYNPNGSSGTTVRVSTVNNIEVGMSISGTGFSGQLVESIVDSTTIIVSTEPTSPTGLLSFSSTKWRYAAPLTPTTESNARVGYAISVSKDSNMLLVSAPGVSTGGKVYVYKNNAGTYESFGSVIEDGELNFGQSVAMSLYGDYIAISSVLSDTATTNTLIDQGKVTIYKLGATEYSEYQEITNIKPEMSGYFGSKLFFMNDSKTLVVYSVNADGFIGETFDNNATTFDSEITTFVTKQVNSGRIDVYDRYATKWIFSESLKTGNVEADGYGESVAVANDLIVVGAPREDVSTLVNAGVVYQYAKPKNSYTWLPVHKEIDKPDLSKIKSVFLYNKETNDLLGYLDVIDSSQGKIPGIAEQELKYKTFYDPATYSVGTSSVTVDDGMAWTKAQVGMLWWDLRTSKFINSYDQDLVYRNSTWNTLFPGASVDVYEWVESTLLPAAWDEQADTEAGIALGISGTSLYGNTVYSINRRYDNISKTFKNTYYYWVKNKKTTPNIVDRNMSAQDVADLIANPRGEGYKYLALTGTNSFTLVNIKPSLSAKEVVLSVEYWTTEKTNQNIHSEWKLVSNNPNSQIPPAIEQKWFDSLTGKDTNDRSIPDMDLPPKLRYGIEFRPRQGMFVNRFEALKQFVEQANLSLIENQITNQRDLTKLESYDPEPSDITGLYDTVVDTDAELRFASIGSFRRASLTPVITNGKITGVDIGEAGAGYLVAPYFNVVGSGSGAKIRAVINAKGQITSADIISSGSGYDSNTVILIRDYCVLVHSDSQANSAWSVYSYDPVEGIWIRVLSQSYDTRRYWYYVDWYASGYSQFTAINFAVETFTNLNGLSSNIGQLVKVRTDNTGNWVLLRKYAESTSVDWTQSYEVVGSQNGTIQLSSSLYLFSDTSYGYDGSLYDGSVFDNSASAELRTILNALKENILIDTLRSAYLNLFFSSIRYVLSEQHYVDWIFKTSFVKAQHNVGPLHQSVTYQNDNLSDFEAYVSEVKPYRTKVREYVSSYEKIDNTPLSLTDFDLQPVYSNGELSVITTPIVDGEITADNSAILTYPWKHWLDNVGFEVTELRLVDGGTEYRTEPVVEFVGACTEPATARAFISNGKVNRIILLSSGKGYLKAPTVVINGGNDGELGTPARVVAVIGNSVVRSNLIKMKFDRVTQTYFITHLDETESFVGTGSRVQWPLKWAPDVRIGKTTVRVDGVEILRSDYTLRIVKSTTRGYTSYSGSITFDVAVVKNAVITITYIKDWSLLNAADRVQYYYNPESGNLGKDLSQLMTGIDYGGVIISGLGFEIGQGWDSLPYYSDKWDSFDATFDDYITTVAAGEHSFSLPYVPEAGTEINIYHAQLVTQAYESDGSTLEYEFNENNGQLNIIVNKTVSTTVSSNNVAGSDVLTITSTDGIEVGDVVTTVVLIDNKPPINYNTVVLSVENGTDLIIDQVLLKPLPGNTAIVFTRTLTENVDYNADLFNTIKFEAPIDAGDEIVISSLLRPVRIEQALISNNGIADGTAFVFTIDDSIVVNDNDQFILRKSTSDGSIAPQADDYDTALTGGNLAYSTATGLRAEDIIIDGDGFVTPTSSSAPEEVVPGQVVDAVAIKVTEKPGQGSANITVDNFVSDGNTVEFVLSKLPNSLQAVIVKVSDGETRTILTQGDDYEYDYKSNKVTLLSEQAEKSLISIIGFGFSGSNILDIDYFVADGSTLEFITKAPWASEISSMVYVDGLPVTPTLFETDSTYEKPGVVGMRFSTPPFSGSVITFVIVLGTEQTFAITKTERIAGTGALTYDLVNKEGVKEPISSSMIVRVNQQILKPANNSYYTIGSNRLNYVIDSNKFVPNTVDIGDIIVIANGTRLTIGTDYTVDLSGITVKINRRVYQKYSGTQLVVSIIRDQEYSYSIDPATSTPQISFAQSYNGEDVIEVTTSYNHNILEVQRSTVNVTADVSLTPNTVEYYEYNSVSAGIIQLGRQVVSEHYVWITNKNNTLLTPGVDFILNEDKQSIKLTQLPNPDDSFNIMTYSANVLVPSVSFMQFKDMLNRTHFKRLNPGKTGRLVTDLVQTDLTIELDNASMFDVPNPALNKPGIIEINGERIEYFSLEGNVLGQLRRGTLGTGVPQVHSANTLVQDIGTSETIPYSDETIIEQKIYNGSKVISLDTITPEALRNSYNFTDDAWEYNTLPSGYSQANDIEVFVGGYANETPWAPKVVYSVDSIVVVGSYTYRCVAAHTSSDTFEADRTTYWTFFIGNIRLKKRPYKVHNVNVHSESPEGDVWFDADFSVTGEDQQVRLTNNLAAGTRVTVVKRMGRVWEEPGKTLLQSDNKIANFVKNILPVNK